MLLWDTRCWKNCDLVLVKSFIHVIHKVSRSNVHYSSVVIDALSQFSKHSKAGVACLYADYKDQSNQTPVHILGSFLHQFLASSQEPIQDTVIQKLQEIQRERRNVGIEDIIDLLKNRLHQLEHAFFCIDAVDELEPKVRQQLLNILKELVTTNNNIRLFLTGRGHVESEVQKRFNVPQGYTIHISASQQDIREFIRQQIKEDCDLNPEAMDIVLAKDIEDAIIEKSKGM